ncbi:hypothetical protein DMB66_06695 [Actinoplanes sp. ATCC 53533]|uniref:hypothetical protein n=1 Tax=Actinoplanes sp. ATCC 53533 TaxID=1288362 RepID=UPI000F79924F|nr:hypothetical protein [Actinoplanes sp. ATCC 53533]RSM72269.1 hypothetical protein DMB66_06695 [Actinoplanes sp. ATCC 53533]
MPPDDRREVGSEFHWEPAVIAPSPDSPLPQRFELFATGCGALCMLVRQLAPWGRLHVPSFFCMGVAEALSADAPITWYRHLPDGQGPRLTNLHAVPGDVVLAQNLFGRDEQEPWDAWMRAHPGVTVVEDHSHDPFGAWARASTAPYAVASLRKTLPLPDGGLLWSPRGLDLPRPSGPESPGAHLKLAAMLLKDAWLGGRAVPKEAFRALQQRGEHALLGSAGPASALTATVLPLLDVAGLRAASTRNAHALTEALAGRAGREWRILTGGPAGAAPFRVQLLCVSPAVRDALLAHLAGQGIFAPVHWRQDRGGWWSGDEAAADLADRILTVPVDHRCGPGEVRRVAEVLGAFAAAPAPA